MIRFVFVAGFSIYNFKIWLSFKKVISQFNDIGRNHGISFNLLCVWFKPHLGHFPRIWANFLDVANTVKLQIELFL